MKEIVEVTKLIKVTAATSIQRLRDKLFVDRHSYKDGQAGWTQYKISEIAYKEFVQRNLTLNKTAQVHTELHANASSKLVSNIINTNLLTQSDELDGVQFGSIEKVGITKSILNDLRKNKWNVTRFQLETHIERFSKWILMPDKFKNIHNPRAIFCSNIKTICDTGIDPLDWIKTDSDLEIDNLLNLRKQKLEERKRQQEEIQVIAFEEWKFDLSKLNSLSMIPENEFLKYGSDAYDKILKNYFIENIWQNSK